MDRESVSDRFWRWVNRIATLTGLGASLGGVTAMSAVGSALTAWLGYLWGLPFPILLPIAVMMACGLVWLCVGMLTVKQRFASAAAIIPADPTAEQELLLGKWDVRSAADEFHATWDFQPGGTVVEESPHGTFTGTWKMEPLRVLITWKRFRGENKRALWDSFFRPIRPEVRGDNWFDHDCVLARKIEFVR